eukprot:SM000019S05092  [mRNA]  locus=s19:951065:955793:+ [translate_table: standard]
MEDAKGGGDGGGRDGGGGGGLVAWLRHRPDERLGELAPIAGLLVARLHRLGSPPGGCPDVAAAEDAPAVTAAARRAMAVLCQEARCGSLHAALDPAAAGGSSGAVAFVRAIAFSGDLCRLWRCLVLCQPWPEDGGDDGDDHDRQLGRNPHASGPAVDEAPLAMTSNGDWRRESRPWHDTAAEPALPLLKAALLAAPAASLGSLLAGATAASDGSGSSGGLEAVAWVLGSMAASRRGPAVARKWAAAWAALVCAAGDDEALARVAVVRRLLTAALLPDGDLAVVGSSDRADASRVLKGPMAAALVAELQTAWPALLALLRRPGCHALHMEVLELVAALDDAAPPRLQAAAARLQATLGLLFSRLPVAPEEVPAASSLPASRACEHLRRLAVRLAAGGGSHTLAMLVGHALDCSFELAAACSHPEQAPMAVQRHGRPVLAASAAAMSGAATLCGAHGHLEADGNLALPYGGGLALPPQGTAVVGLLGENCKRRRLSPLLSAPLAGGRGLLSTTEAADDGSRSHHRMRAQNGAAVNKSAAPSDRAFVELTSLVRATLRLATKAAAEGGRGLGGGATVPEWHLAPVGVLCSQLAARMDLPHEPPMTMEEYEQVLPRKVTSARHNILAAACRHNTFLFQLLALAAEQGPSRELLRCAELLRVLLADAISSWHSHRHSSEARTVSSPLFTPAKQWPVSSDCQLLTWPPAMDAQRVALQAQEQRLTVEEQRAEELLRLVGRAGWLPRPLASCAELVALLDRADVPDLLMLAWRCMHHAMAFGPHSWGSRHRSPSFSSSIQQLAPTDGGYVELLPPPLPAVARPGSEVPEAAAAAATLGLEAEEDLTFTEWEGHLFAILRRNIAHIGAHFAQIFPV